MGEVYRARDTRLKCAVALKRLSPALRNDSALSPPLMRKRSGRRKCATSRGWLRFTIFWKRETSFPRHGVVEGETLRQRLTRPIQLQEFLYIAGQCAEALVAAHDRGILHGDIKPENIMLRLPGRSRFWISAWPNKCLGRVP